jgi:hypothetical protein
MIKMHPPICTHYQQLFCLIFAFLKCQVFGTEMAQGSEEWNEMSSTYQIISALDQLPQEEEKNTAHTHWFKPSFGVSPLIRCFHGTYHWWLCLYFMTPLITACFFAPNLLSFSHCPISNRRKTRFVLKVSRFVILVLFNRTWRIQYSCSENQKLSDFASHNATFVIRQCVLLIDQLINHFN